MASHRKPPTFSLPAVGRRTAALAAAAPLAMLIGGGVAVADTGSASGQTAGCHESICAPVNVGVNAPFDGIGVAVLDVVHPHHH